MYLEMRVEVQRPSGELNVAFMRDQTSDQVRRLIRGGRGNIFEVVKG
jgi:hypothetical protein